MCECGDLKPWLLPQERETHQSVGYILWQACGRIPEAQVGPRHHCQILNEFLVFCIWVSSKISSGIDPTTNWTLERLLFPLSYIWPICIFNDLKCQSNDYFVLFSFGHLCNLTWSVSSTLIFLSSRFHQSSAVHRLHDHHDKGPHVPIVCHSTHVLGYEVSCMFAPVSSLIQLFSVLIYFFLNVFGHIFIFIVIVFVFFSSGSSRKLWQTL